MNGAVTPLGLGELKASRDRHEVLVCYGLGSCIGVVLYDPAVRVAGMAHVVLPDSSLGRGREPPGKFADTAVPALVEAMVRLGAAPARLHARIAGGACVLAIGEGSPGLDIGSRNAASVRITLDRYGIPLLAMDVGGRQGRTLQCHVGTGRVKVSTVGQGEREL